MNSFEEIQRVRKMSWYWIIFIPLVSFGIWGLINLVGTKDENHINTSLIVFCSIPIVLSLFGFFLNLKTDYNEKEITLRFLPLPFFKRTIFWNQINKAYIRKFDWGEFRAIGSGAIPLGNRGRAYHLYGEYGLQIETTDGDKILIGTRKPKSLQEFLKRLNKL
jgi:hypothetical protein